MHKTSRALSNTLGRVIKASIGSEDGKAGDCCLYKGSKREKITDSDSGMKSLLQRVKETTFRPRNAPSLPLLRRARAGSAPPAAAPSVDSRGRRPAGGAGARLAHGGLGRAPRTPVALMTSYCVNETSNSRLAVGFSHLLPLQSYYHSAFISRPFL